MFKKADLEIQLITKQTLEELTENINTETLPFTAATSGAASAAKTAVSKFLGRFR